MGALFGKNAKYVGSGGEDAATKAKMAAAAAGPAPVTPPPLPTDLTDAALQEAAKSTSMTIGGLRGRRSTFLTGQSADSTMGPTKPKTILGGY